MKISPFSPQKKQDVQILDGISIAVTNCGLKKNLKDDLVLIKLSNPSNILGYFTTSKTPGEPIKWNKSIIEFGKVSLILINSGNANVFTGKKGEYALKKIVSELSERMNIPKKEIYIASTGVIGELLDEKKIIKQIPKLIENLNNRPEEWIKAANAIRTTDTFPKIESKNLGLNKNIIINGIAKGSGMIAPNMATMLAFIFTNAKLKNSLLKKEFSKLINQTFNSITVDGEKSTSDMVLFVSIENKNQENKIVLKSETDFFLNCLKDLMKSLAHKIVQDGEGAKKFITLNVSGAKNDKEAKIIALSVANSPLFKTAIAGEDSNWGRIIMAIGKTDTKIDSKKISIKFGNIQILTKGNLANKLKSSLLDNYMKNKKIDISIDLGLGKGTSQVWTCDFTQDYIKINADYRT